MEIENMAWRSPNHSERVKTIDSIVLHTGEGTKKSDLDWLCNPSSGVSSHFYVDRNGQIFQLVNLDRVAWHAGRCDYAGRKDWNAQSIGIETEHKRGQDWPEAQKQSLFGLCQMLIGMYPIRQSHVVAHRWVAIPRWPWPRKSDPSDWSNNELRMWIAALYGKTTDVRDHKVKLSTLPWAVIRRDPTRASAKIGTLMPGEPFAGTLTTHGQAYAGDARWVKRIDELGGGYVWYGLVNLVM